MAMKNPFMSAEERTLLLNRNELRRILSLPDNDGRRQQLSELASKIGASTIKLYPGHGDASVPELVQNIHVALQTQAMLATLRTTTNYVTATVALVVVSLLGVVTAFVAAL